MILLTITCIHFLNNHIGQEDFFCLLNNFDDERNSKYVLKCNFNVSQETFTCLFMDFSLFYNIPSTMTTPQYLLLDYSKYTLSIKDDTTISPLKNVIHIIFIYYKYITLPLTNIVSHHYYFIFKIC